MFNRSRQIVAKRAMFGKIRHSHKRFFQGPGIDHQHIRKTLALACAGTGRTVVIRRIRPLQALVVSTCQILQAFHTASRNHERKNAAFKRSILNIHNLRLFFEKHMRVRTAETERIHAREHAFLAAHLR